MDGGVMFSFREIINADPIACLPGKLAKDAFDNITREIDAIVNARISVFLNPGNSMIVHRTTPGESPDIVMCHCLNSAGEWTEWQDGEPPEECLLPPIVADITKLKEG